MMDCGLYEIRNMTTDVRYVGSSVHISSRLKEHSRMLKIGKHHSIYLQRAWNKYGCESFVMRPIAYLEESELKETERRLIDSEKKGDTYNISNDPLSPMRGNKHTLDTRKKMSEDRSGERNPFYGKTHSAESLAKINTFKKGMKPWNTGKTFSDSAKEKMRLARLGKSPSNRGDHSSHCFKGHEMSGDNLYVYMRNGLPKHICRECAKERSKKYALLAARQIKEKDHPIK